ncbi:hypothetical protein C7271_20785, partial [filamentous cyanobacterium CCP5]
MAAPLEQALECLPIDLDEELIRYRRALRGDSPAIATNRLRRRRQSLDLIQVAGQPVTGAGSNPPGPNFPPPPPLPPNPKAAVSVVSAQGEAPSVLAQTTAGLATIGGSLAAYDPIPQDYLETTEALLNADGVAREDADYEPPLVQRLSTPLGLGALLLLLLSCVGLGFLITNPNAVRHLLQHPALLALR